MTTVLNNLFVMIFKLLIIFFLYDWNINYKLVISLISFLMMGKDQHLFVLCGVKVHYEGAILSKKMYFFFDKFCIILGVV
jgi:hypothetical protein